MTLLLTALVHLLLCNSGLAAPAFQIDARQDGAAAEPTATIDSGVVIGLKTSVANSPNLVNKYLGVPFAASPTRFAPAQTATPWSEPYMATENGPACIQVSMAMIHNFLCSADPVVVLVDCVSRRKTD